MLVVRSSTTLFYFLQAQFPDEVRFRGFE